MLRNPRRCPGKRVLAALTVLGAQSIGLAAAQPVTDGAPKSVQTGAAKSFVPARWTLQKKAQLALVGAGNGEAGVFAGIQCDPFDPRSHRMIFGALRTAQATDPMELLQNQSVKLVISTTGPSLSTKFEIYPEDRGQSNLGGASSYVAAYLNQQQFDALYTARDFVLRAGTHSYSFSGAGSARAIGAMACQSTELHVASRLIASRREDASAQYLGGWQLALHSGTAAFLRGRAEAFASTTNHPANPAASFRIGVSCNARRLYAHLDVGINPRTTDDENLSDINTFIHEFGQNGKLVEVYRAGHRVTAILVDSDEITGRGHALSSHDLASLMDADALAVVGDHQVIEFSTANAAASLESLSRLCSRTS